MLLYSTVFEIGDGNRLNQASLEHIRQILRDWINFGLNKFHGQPFEEDLASSFEFRGKNGAIVVENDIRELDLERGTQTIRYEQPDNAVSGQYWVNNIRLAWDESIEYSHTVEVMKKEGGDSAPIGLEFTNKPPAVIRELFKLLPCKHENIPLKIPTKFGRTEVGGFVDDYIENPSRKWPVVLFTWNSGEDYDEYDRTFMDASRRLAGLAIVVSANGPPATRTLKSVIGAKHTPWEGAIGIYNKGYDHNEAHSDFELILPHQVLDIQNDPGGITQYLIDSMSLRLSNAEMVMPLYRELRDEVTAKKPTFQPEFKKESLLSRVYRRFRLLFRPNWKKQVSTLRSEVRTLTSDRDRIVDVEDARISVLGLKLKEVRDELKLSKSQQGSLRTDNKRLNKQIEEMVESVGAVSRQRLDVSAQAHSFQVDASNLKLENSRLKRELAGKDGQLNQKIQGGHDAIDRLEDSERKRSLLKEEMGSLRKELDELKDTIRGDSLDDAKDQGYRKQISALGEKFNTMEKDRDEWKGRHQDAASENRRSRQNLYDKITGLEKEKTTLRNENHQIREMAGARDEKDDELKNVFDALDKANNEFEMLYVFDDALKSAKASPFINPEQVYHNLREMVTSAEEYLEDGEGMSYRQCLQKIFGASNVAGESKETMRKFKRNFKTEKDGKKIAVEMKDHVKIGNTWNDHQTMLRIYFILDEKNRHLLIGYCGKHLDNYTTGRKS